MLSDGKLVTASYLGKGGGEVLAWNTNRTEAPALWVRCEAYAVAVVDLGHNQSNLAIAHIDGGITMWSLTNSVT